MRMEVNTLDAYAPNAPKRAFNLYLNEELVSAVRALTPNLSAQVELLLADFLAAERDRRYDADATLGRALADWNGFADMAGSFADEHSTL